MIALLARQDEVFQSSTITVSTEAADFPKENLTGFQFKKRFRTTSKDNQWVKFDLGSAKAVSIFSIFRNNLTSGATFKLFGHASDLGTDWSAASFQQDLTFDSQVGVVRPSTVLRWWFLSINDAGNPANYIELGPVFGGPIESFNENFHENFGEGLVDPSIGYWTQGGAHYATKRERYKTFDVPFVDIDTQDQETIRKFYDKVGLTEPFLVALDENENVSNWCRIVKLVEDIQFMYAENSRADVQLIFRELR